MAQAGSRTSRPIGTGWRDRSTRWCLPETSSVAGGRPAGLESDGSLLLPTDGRVSPTRRRSAPAGRPSHGSLLPATSPATARRTSSPRSLTASWLYPGNGTGAFLARKQIGSGWARFNQVVAGNDFNGDGKADLMARATDGTLSLCPGSGSSGFLARARLGDRLGRLHHLRQRGPLRRNGQPERRFRVRRRGLWLPYRHRKGHLPERRAEPPLSTGDSPAPALWVSGAYDAG